MKALILAILLPCSLWAAAPPNGIVDAYSFEQNLSPTVGVDNWTPTGTIVYNNTAAPLGIYWLGPLSATWQINAPAGFLTAMSAQARWSIEYYENCTDASFLPTWLTDSGVSQFWIQHHTSGIRMSCNGVITNFYATAPVNATGTTFLTGYSYDGANINLYVNNVLVQSTPTVGGQTPTITNMRIGGAFAGTNSLKIDRLVFTTTARSSFPTPFTDAPKFQHLRLNLDLGL